MPYPSKTDRATILAAAFDQLSQDGLEALSLRSLASSLGLAPNALYRYFGDRAALESALTAESIRSLHAALKSTVEGRTPDETIRGLTEAYLRFARERPHLYGMMMRECTSAPEDADAHEELWAFFVQEVARLSGEARAAEAAVALWAFMHGMAELEAAGVFGEQKPDTGLEFGLNGWLAAASRQAGSSPKHGAE
jgi:AcrR family transcriptional regulator